MADPPFDPPESPLPLLPVVVAAALPDPLLPPPAFTPAAEMTYTWLSAGFVYVNTDPLAGAVTVPGPFDNVAVPLAGRLAAS